MLAPNVVLYSHDPCMHSTSSNASSTQLAAYCTQTVLVLLDIITMAAQPARAGQGLAAMLGYLTISNSSHCWVVCCSNCKPTTARSSRFCSPRQPRVWTHRRACRHARSRHTSSGRLSSRLAQAVARTLLMTPRQSSAAAARAKALCQWAPHLLRAVLQRIVSSAWTLLLTSSPEKCSSCAAVILNNHVHRT